MSKKSPQLRFEGFTDDWEQRKLNEVSDIYDGTHQTPKYQDDGVMFLSVENIKTLTSNKFISREAFEVEFKIRPQRGDVLMTRIGDIGTANVVETDEDLAYYVSLALFKSEELNPYFLQSSIYAPFVQDQIWKRTLHIAFPKKINKNEIGQVPINVPTLAEQTKIGSFFKQLDNTITLHQRKLDKLKSVKQAYLSEMFPAEGERVPKRRFPGFTDDWELRKLGDTVIEIIAGGDIDKNKVVEFGKYPIYANSHSGDGIVGYYDDFYRVNGPAVTVTGRGEVGFAKARETDFTPVVRLLAIRSKHNHCFLENAINLHGVTVESTGVPQLTVPQLSAYRIYFPYDIQEENQIGTFFSTLDQQITLHQRKLDLLKEQKKGFLQKMFPKNGAKVPELRFAGFADDWEERKLGDVVGEIQSGNRLPKDSLTSGNIPYVVAQTKNEGVFKTISKKTLDYNGNPMKLFPGNSISFSIDNPEAMFYRSTEFYTSNIMRVIHADYLSHQQYLFILENMKSFTRGYDWSRKFSGPVVSNLEYLQPNEQEQCKIGSFILAFDNIITLHQRKLDLLKEQKKGLLQKMFV